MQDSALSLVRSAMTRKSHPISNLQDLAPHEKKAVKGDESIFSMQLSESDWRIAFWFAAYGGQVMMMHKMATHPGRKIPPMVQLITSKHRGSTPLHAAARKAQVASMAYLLGLGADINARDEQKRTPLLVLLMESDEIPESDRKEAARYLLQEGAFPDLHDNSGNTPRAFLEQKWKMGVYLAEEGQLFQAIARGDIAQLSQCLNGFERGRPPQDPSGATPFHRVILSPSAHPQEAPYYRSSPLEDSSSWKEEMIRLLAQKFDVDRKNRHGKTPLYLAAERLEYQLAECLLQRGAKPNLLSSSESKAPLHLAETPEFVRLLSSYGADLNVREGITQKTPLHIAASRGRSLVVKTLMDEGADEQLVDCHWNTVLHVCRTYESALPVLKKSADLVNAQNEWGATPLLCAIQRESFLWMRTGNLDLIRALAKNADLSLAASGVSGEVQYSGAFTPLELANRLLEYVCAREGDHSDMIGTFSEIVRILQEALREQQESSCILI